MPSATIDLGALAGNVATLRRRLAPETELLAAVKANAYGHGAVPVARKLQSYGVSWFGVATVDEALELREAGVSGRILLFSPVWDRVDELAANDVTLVVTDERDLEAACGSGSDLKIHLKVDTGMGRLGHDSRQAVYLAEKIDRATKLALEGVWTHLACADEVDPAYTERQLERFDELLNTLRVQGIEPPVRHAANSAGVIAHQRSHFDLVRPGIGLYGYHASRHVESLEPNLKPILTVSAPVTFVKRVREGTAVSYGATWQARRDTTVATVRYGYADGYPRLLGNRAAVNVQGEFRPVVGRVCMDQLMVDVGDLVVRAGERVILFGPDGPTAQDLAEQVGTISYELLTSVAPRVKRSYHG